LSVNSLQRFAGMRARRVPSWSVETFKFGMGAGGHLLVMHSRQVIAIDPAQWLHLIWRGPFQINKPGEPAHSVHYSGAFE